MLPLKWQMFRQTDLGKLYQAIPFDALAGLFPKAREQGRPSWFKVQGGIGLMVLKSYLGLSDQKLLNRLNTDWAMQLFCGIRLKEGQVIKDRDIVSRWRRYLGTYLDIDAFQVSLSNYWQGYLKHRHMVLMDATCYETQIRYPTDVKLVWEGVDWLHHHLKALCTQQRVRRPRYKYKEVQKSYLRFQKSRKKSYALRVRIHRRLCHLLHKLLGLFTTFVQQHSLHLKPRHLQRLQTIQKMYEQQQWRFRDKARFEQIAGRLVSIYKPYIRPIKRGKEIKSTEFGAKVHTFQIDGINFVDLISFDAFNESTRLEGAVWKAQRLMHTKMHQLGADQIYATNRNRSYCTKNEIATCFVPKGRVSKLEPQAKTLRTVIAKGRATAMEGAFGNEKNHYGLQKIKARTRHTEVLWIFFGIMTANMVNISKRMERQASKKCKKAA